MKTLMPAAAVLGLLLATACSDRNAENSKEFAEEQVSPTTSAPAPDYAAGAGTTGLSDRELSAPADTARRTAPSSARKNNTVRRDTAPERVEREVEPRRAPAPPMTSLDHRRPETAAPVAAPRAMWTDVTVPAGSSLALELQTALSSETAKVETPVRARLRSALTINGQTAIPAGAVLVGTVTDVERAGRVKGRARLTFAFHEVELDNGREDLRTNPITFEGEQSKGEDATKVGVGAGIGAIIGGIVGGAGGAAKGAIIGGGAGTGAVLATRGKEVTVASGTPLNTNLADSITVRVPNR